MRALKLFLNIFYFFLNITFIEQNMYDVSPADLIKVNSILWTIILQVGADCLVLSISRTLENAIIASDTNYCSFFLRFVLCLMSRIKFVHDSDVVY